MEYDKGKQNLCANYQKEAGNNVILLNQILARESIWPCSTYLTHIVERKPVKKNVREEFPQAEDAIDYPVCQPLCVILLIRAFYCFDTKNVNKTK